MKNVKLEATLHSYCRFAWTALKHKSQEWTRVEIMELKTGGSRMVRTVTPYTDFYISDYREGEEGKQYFIA